MRRTASEVLRSLEKRVARLEKQAQRLRPNMELCDLLIESIMERVERAKALNKTLYSKGMTLKDLTRVKPPEECLSPHVMDQAIKDKDFNKIERRGRYLLEDYLDDPIEWQELMLSFSYMRPSFSILGDLLRREDVWGEEGFRKFKMGWAKFKKSAQKEWDEFQETIRQFERVQDNHLAGGVTLHFKLEAEGAGGEVSASMNMKTGVLSVYLAGVIKKSSRSLRTTIEHELVHYEQFQRGQNLERSPSRGLENFFEEHSLRDEEFDPRLNDVSNAVSDLIESGLSAREAIDLLSEGKEMPNGIWVDYDVYETARQWLGALKRHDRTKFQRALQEIEGDFL